MAKTNRVMPAFNGVANASRATLNLPIGLTYHGLVLIRGGTTFAHDGLGEMVLKANGREIMEFSAADLDDVNVFDGMAAGGANLSRLSFERFNLKQRSWVEATAIGTGIRGSKDEITSLTLECNLTGTSAPTLSAIAIQSAPSVLGAIVKRRRFTRTISGAGVLEISDLPKGDLIDRIFIKAASGNLTEVELKRDNYTVFERTLAENNLIQSDGIRVPVANMFVIDPSENGNGNEAIVSNVNDFRLLLTASGADTFTIYVDYIGGLGGN